jgi:hypothetical protein
MPTLQHETNPTEGDLQTIREGLARYNRQFTGEDGSDTPGVSSVARSSA